MTILADIAAESRLSRAEVLASLNAKIDQMREREAEVQQLLAVDGEWTEAGPAQED